MFGFGDIANADPDIPTGVPMSNTAFNTIWKTSPNEILYRHCEDCSPSHEDIYMRRTGDTDKNLPFDMLKMVLEDWFTVPNNVLGTNFDLYDTYEDALAQTDKWMFCNYNDAGVGFPRDCGKTGKVTNNWNAINHESGNKRSGKNNFFFAVETLASAISSNKPSVIPSSDSTQAPSVTLPSKMPSNNPSTSPSNAPSVIPSGGPSVYPSKTPSVVPSMTPSAGPSDSPSMIPSAGPSEDILLNVASEVLGNCASTSTSTSCADDGRNKALEWFTNSTNHPDNYIITSNETWLVS